MPYISSSQKEKIDRGLVASHLSEFKDAGGLNYAIHKLIAEYLSQNKESYQTYNDIIGALECVKMEIYRRKIGVYEEVKIVQNGDVKPYSNE
jgi:hypothetical protein